MGCFAVSAWKHNLETGDKTIGCIGRLNNREEFEYENMETIWKVISGTDCTVF